MTENGVLASADIVVVGGGVVGLTCALELRRRGFDVVVVEQRFLAFGASGRGSGAVWLQLRRTGAELDLARRSLEKYREYETELGPTFDLRNHGGLFFFENDRQRAVLEGYAADRSEAGLDVSVLTREEAEKLSPVLPDRALGAVYCADDAQVDAQAFVRALGATCVRRGVRIFENTAVLGSIRAIDTVTGLRTVRGEVHAGGVVWATGAWSSTLRSEGLTLPLETVRVGQLMTQPVKYRPGAVLHGPRGVDRCGALVDLPQFDPLLFSQAGTGEETGLAFDDTLAQNTEGAVIVGNSIDGRGSLNPHISMTATQAMIDMTLSRTASYGPLGVTGLWAGLVAETPDQLPIVDCVDGLYISAGHSWGIASGPACGEVLARLAAGEDDPMLARLAADRASLRQRGATRSPTAA